MKRTSVFYPSSGGFTLLELLVVLFIVSLSTALIMPSIWRSDSALLRTEARKFSSTLRYIHDEAVGKKRLYRFTVNFDDGTWGFESEEESRRFTAQGDSLIRSIVVPSRGRVSEGRLTVIFGPMGSAEPLLVNLAKEGAAYTVLFNNISGRTRIVEGSRL